MWKQLKNKISDPLTNLTFGIGKTSYDNLSTIRFWFQNSMALTNITGGINETTCDNLNGVQNVVIY
jgi:hypothetical protein